MMLQITLMSHFCMFYAFLKETLLCNLQFFKQNIK